MNQKTQFSSYQKQLIAVLSLIQFTVILDFMVLAPLGALLMPALKITPAQFGWVVSGYAFSAGASGLLSAGIADHFDRKKLLVLFYIGFLVGTLFCALSPTYPYLLAARMFTGVFGGVLGSISFAIVADVFEMQVRGRAIGLMQTAFSGSQVLGLPVGMYFANKLGWHWPFLIIVGLGLFLLASVIFVVKPLAAHIDSTKKANPFGHIVQTLSTPRYVQAFGATALMSTGAFMIMPFSSAFNVKNLSIDLQMLPTMYMITGVVNLFINPLMGRLVDRHGKFEIFMFGSIINSIMVLVYTFLTQAHWSTVVFINCIMFVGISARIVSSQALMSAVPDPKNRGAFMAVGQAVQQFSGGLASVLAGLIVAEAADGKILHFDRLGIVVCASVIAVWFMMYFIDKNLKKSTHILKNAPLGTAGH